MFTRLRKNRFMVMFSVLLSMSLGAISSVNALNDPSLGLYCGDYNYQVRAEMAQLWQGTPLQDSLPSLAPKKTDATHCGACAMPHPAIAAKSQPQPDEPVPLVLARGYRVDGKAPLPSPFVLPTTRAPPVSLA